MRRYRRIEIQVGVFSIIAILVLVFGLLWLREVRFARRYSIYKVTFADTGGLIPGNTVMVSGFRKGTVSHMRLLERGVEVDLAIEQDVVLRQDARAFIASRGLLGERYVELDRGAAATVLAPGAELQGEKQMGMAELMAGTGELVESARALSGDLNKIVVALSHAVGDDQLRVGIQDASAAARELREVLATNRESFTASVENFQRTSESLARVTGRSENDAVALVSELRSVTSRMDSLMGQLQSAASKTDRVADRLLAEDTSFGRIVGERELYDRLVRVAGRADSLLAEIERNPRRFFKFSVF
jgi:phospholipid/cholesterol/gamma-HCH transport system substrate-binding protein